MTHVQPTESTPVPITREQARKVLATIDAGLRRGLGSPEPGQMCLEAAICYGLGLPHGEDPGCVAESLRRLSLRLNDALWSSRQARARGLRRLGLVQLGSQGTIDEAAFVERVVQRVIGRSLSQALRAVASIHTVPTQQAGLNAAASKCESDPTLETCVQVQSSIIDTDDEADMALQRAIMAVYEMAANAATAAAHVPSPRAARNAAEAAESAAFTVQALCGGVARDESLAAFAEDVVQLLIEMKAPGCEWLELTQSESPPLAASM